MSLIHEIIQEGENQRTSLAPPGVALETVGKTVCGMLNAEGGRVLWGVDRHGDAAGLPDATARVKELNTILMESTTPRPLLSISEEKTGDRSLVLVEIPPGADKPYSFQRRIWVRVGRQTLRVTEEKSARMVEESALRESRWGREPMPGFHLPDCDERELKEAHAEIEKVGRFGIEVPSENEELLRRLYLMNSSQFTNAAMLLFAQDPLVWSPNVALRIISYAGEKQGRVLHEQTLQGPAVRVLRQAINVIQQQTGFSARFRKGKLEREDRPAYALYALREGLVNAMVHRDYEGLSGQLRVEIFPDHLMIQNPGTLPPEWTVRDIVTKEESHPTNPDVARVFYLRGLMERLGLGGRKLVEECKLLNAKKPVWKAKAGVVSLILYRAPRMEDTLRLHPRMMKFLGSLPRGAEFKADQYAKRAKVSLRQARRDLDFLVEGEEIVRRGRGPATVYRREEGRA